MITDNGPVILEGARNKKAFFYRTIEEGKAIYVARNRAARRYLLSNSVLTKVHNGLFKVEPVIGTRFFKAY